MYSLSKKGWIDGLFDMKVENGCFGPLKVNWHKQCWARPSSHPGPVIAKYMYQFSGNAWVKSIWQTSLSVFVQWVFIPSTPPQYLYTMRDGSRHESLAGLQFILLYGPTRQRSNSKSTTYVVPFKTEEITVFQKDLEKVDDDCYQQWIWMYHPECNHWDTTLDTLDQHSIFVQRVQLTTSTPIANNI